MNQELLCLRRATLADLPALHALIQRSYRGETARGGWSHEADLVQGERISHQDLAALIDSAQDRFLVAENAGTLIGCVHICAKTATTSYFGLLTVDPGRQAAGLGKRLIGAAEATARQDFGATEMELTVLSTRAELIAYYQRRGYHPTGACRPFPIALTPPLLLRVLAKSL